MGRGDLCRVPQQRYATGEPGKDPRGRYSGKIRPGPCRVPPAAVCNGRARQSSGTGPCRDCRGVVGIVVPIAPQGLFGENSFYPAPGDKWP